MLFRQPLRGSGWAISPASNGAWVARPFFGIRKDRRPPPATRLLRIHGRSAPHLDVVELDASPWALSGAAGVTWVAAGAYSHQVLRIDETREPVVPVPVGVASTVTDVQAAPLGAWVAQMRPNLLTRIC